jgi:hypothetical protein
LQSKIAAKPPSISAETPYPNTRSNHNICSYSHTPQQDRHIDFVPQIFYQRVHHHHLHEHSDDLKIHKKIHPSLQFLRPKDDGIGTTGSQCVKNFERWNVENVNRTTHDEHFEDVVRWLRIRSYCGVIELVGGGTCLVAI